VHLVCVHLAERWGAEAVLLVTYRDNLRAQRAYERVGFRRIGEVLDTDTRGGERIPSYVMRWTLGGG
jgi:RimJ/RimL family protein N-acetyltransferase